MIMPLADDNTGRRTVPFVTFALIAVNVLVFVLFQGIGQNDDFTYAFSCVPREIVTGEDIVSRDQEIQHPVTKQTIVLPGLKPTPGSVYLTLLTSMFMHGGIMHLLGNML